jgi:short-subunit dehydrogenase
MNASRFNAVVTGAASGIGRALASLLAAQHWQLHLVDRDEAGLATLLDSLPADGAAHRTYVCDLARREERNVLLTKVRAACPTLKLLVNNAGTAHYGPTDAMERTDLERLCEVNLLAPMELTHGLLPLLLASPGASLVNIASVYGLCARRKTSVYHATKFGLVGFSESLRKEYRKRLSVTTICPGFVQTQLFANASISTADKQPRHPPAWLCTTPERVAQVALRAMQQRRGLVRVGWHAHALYTLDRWCSGLLWLAGID